MIKGCVVRILVSFVFFMSLSSPLFSFSLSGLFPQLSQTELDTLVSEGSLRESVSAPQDLNYLPNVPLFLSFQDYLTGIPTKSNLDVIYYIPNVGQVPTLKLLNSLLQISTLSGLEFFSRSEKKVKTLIYDVFVIDKPSTSMEKHPDPVLQKVSPETNLFIQQDDETFGKAIYQVTVSYSPENSIGLRIVNLEPLKKGLITMAKEGEFNFFMGLFPVGNDLVIYGITTNKNTPPAFVKKQADASLYNRLDAFKSWIVQRYKTVN